MRFYSFALGITILFQMVSMHRGDVIKNWKLSKPARYHNESSFLSENIMPFVVPDLFSSKKGIFPLKRRNIVLTSTSSQIIPLVVNFVLSLYKLSLSHTTGNIEFIVVTFDEETIALCDRLYMPCWYPLGVFKKGGVISDPLYSKYDTDAFKKRTLAVTRIIHMLLTAGANVLNCDADIVLLKSPFDFFAQRNSFDMFISGNSLDNLNTGFYFVKSTERSIDFFKTMFTKCQTKDIDDQKCFNILANKTGYLAHIDMLPQMIFPTTGCLWGKMSHSKHAGAHVFHASCQLGLQKKLLFFRKHKMIGIGCMRTFMTRRLEMRGAETNILRNTLVSLLNISEQSRNARDFMENIYSNNNNECVW